MINVNPAENTKQNTNPHFGSGRPRFRGPNRMEGPKEFDSKILDLARVSRSTAGGRKFKFRATLVLGNKKGKVGVGIAKGLDVAQAIEKATRVAKKHLIEVPIVNDTIPYEIYAKYGPAKVLLRPQKKGRGLVAGGTVRIICTLAGIKNVSSKILGRTGNKLNNAKATIIALKKLDISSRRSQKKIKTKDVKEEIIQEDNK
ncbi:MAG: 30S ribosomal protein S5 [Candidatus Parcubacteria bacterium]|nr:30S ribosomal protein S5 [Candidatus Parcubacteria bacterium]